MEYMTLTTTEVVALIAVGVIVVAGLVAWVMLGRRRTDRLRTKFGGAEYARAVASDGGRRRAEAGLDQRTARVEGLDVRPLGLADRARFMEAWRGVQAHFVDGPAAAVTEADQLLTDVMSTRGYPVGNFEQRAADVSVSHPGVLQNYRMAHDIVVRQVRGEASTEDLRRAMVHYRSLFDELVDESGPRAGTVAP